MVSHATYTQEGDIWLLALRGDVQGLEQALVAIPHQNEHGERLRRVDSLSECGLAPLHYASMLGHDIMVSMLLRHGANINIQDTVALDTPLHKAARSGRIKTINLLLSSGADSSLADTQGVTPRMLLASKGIDWSSNLQVATMVRNKSGLTNPLASSRSTGVASLLNTAAATKLVEEPTGLSYKLTTSAPRAFISMCEIPLDTIRDLEMRATERTQQANALSQQLVASHATVRQHEKTIRKLSIDLKGQQQETETANIELEKVNTELQTTTRQNQFLRTQQVGYKSLKQQHEMLELERRRLERELNKTRSDAKISSQRQQAESQRLLVDVARLQREQDLHTLSRKHHQNVSAVVHKRKGQEDDWDWHDRYQQQHHHHQRQHHEQRSTQPRPTGAKTWLDHVGWNMEVELDQSQNDTDISKANMMRTPTQVKHQHRQPIPPHDRRKGGRRWYRRFSS